MPTTYRATLTNVGAALVADAIAHGTTLTWAKMALGDGNGSAVIVDAGRTSLVNERYRAPLNDLGRDSANPNTIVGTLVVPPETGGWTIREFGIYDNASTPRLVAYGETPEIEKPASAAGTGINLRLRFKLVVSADANITLSPDSNEAYATIEYVKDNAVKSLSVSGRTITYTMGDGDTHTLQTQDTTYNDATQSVHGLMSANDKTKLDGIAATAEVNQNAFSNVKVGDVTVAADSKTDTLELAAGDNITLTANATNDKITITVDNQWINRTGTPLTRLSGIDNRSPNDVFGIWDGDSGATGYLFLYASGSYKTGATLELVGTNYTGNTFTAGSFNLCTGGPTNNYALRGNPSGLLTWGGNKVITINDLATTSAAGIMSATDKAKLNSITNNAEVNQNAFSNVKVGDVTVAADSKTDTLELAAGDNITLTANATNDKITITVDDQWINRTGTPLTSLSGIDNRSPNNVFGIWDGDSGATGYLFLYASGSYKTGATLELVGINYTGNTFTAGSFNLSTGGPTNNYVLRGNPSGLLTWGGNKVITINDLATTSTAGVMSATDKAKLNGIASNAEVNQNAFSNVKVGNVTVAADSKTDTLTMVAGNYISLTANANNNTVTIDVTMPVVNGTLTATSSVTSNYSSVYRCGRVGYLMIGCGVSAAAKTAWTDTTLYTSDIKPAKAVYQVVNNQDNTSAGCVEITTTGNVILHTYGKALTDGFIRCSVVFAV